MKRPIIVLVVAAGVLAAGGRRRNMGLLIRPVALSEELEETVIHADPGLFVSDKIALVDVDGLLFNQRGGGMFGSGENAVSLFVEKLDKAEGGVRTDWPVHDATSDLHVAAPRAGDVVGQLPCLAADVVQMRVQLPKVMVADGLGVGVDGQARLDILDFLGRVAGVLARGRAVPSQIGRRVALGDLDAVQVRGEPSDWRHILAPGVTDEAAETLAARRIGTERRTG